VIEGTAPTWVDLNADGEREIIVTPSNANTGARMVVYREDGSLFATEDPIGQGFRWRHQLAVAQFIEGGSQEIAVVRTPHIGGVVEIYALDEDRLEIKAELGGYSSHRIGSRNLDSALSDDINQDGQVEHCSRPIPNRPCGSLIACWISASSMGCAARGEAGYNFSCRHLVQWQVSAWSGA